MPRSKKQVANIDDRSRNFRLLLYADNDMHSELLYQIRYNIDALGLPDDRRYIGIMHDGDSEGLVKSHYHVYLMFTYPQWTKSLCRKLGFVNDADEPDDQFLRVIDGRLDNALVYLTHLNSPDKEQYERSDLFASGADVLKLYDDAVIRYQSRHIDKRLLFREVVEWLDKQEGLVSARQLLEYLLTHGCYSVRNESWLRTVWSEHNSRRLYFAKQHFQEAIIDGASKWADFLSGGVFREITPDEWEFIGGDFNDFR